MMLYIIIIVIVIILLLLFYKYKYSESFIQSDTGGKKIEKTDSALSNIAYTWG